MLINLYEKKCSEKSDINEHLPTLKKYGQMCEHITEMGVRGGDSTVALLHSNPKKMISYDIKDNYFTIKNYLISESEKIGTDYNFILSDTLKINIEETDLLFIDTLHTYNQLSKELSLHSKNVKKYIIIHDTTLFGYKDEKIYNHASELLKEIKIEKQGLFNAVLDFLDSEGGMEWEILEKFDNNNGLTILKKIKN